MCLDIIERQSLERPFGLTVWSEDNNSIPGRQLVNCSLVYVTVVGESILASGAREVDDLQASGSTLSSSGKASKLDANEQHTSEKKRRLT